MGPDFYFAFITGLLGGFGHCIGMCGPIVSSYSLCWKDEQGLSSSIVNQLLYNLGRVVTYAFIGAILGWGGSILGIGSSGNIFYIIMPLVIGLIMVLMGLNVSGIFTFALPGSSGPSFIIKATRPLLASNSKMKFFPLGLLLGFLPCGLSYSIFSGALATGTLLNGFLYSLLFGIGTIPALFILGVSVNFISVAMRKRLYQICGILIIIMGAMFIKKGLFRFLEL